MINIVYFFLSSCFFLYGTEELKHENPIAFFTINNDITQKIVCHGKAKELFNFFSASKANFLPMTNISNNIAKQCSSELTVPGYLNTLSHYAQQGNELFFKQYLHHGKEDHKKAHNLFLKYLIFNPNMPMNIYNGKCPISPLTIHRLPDIYASLPLMITMHLNNPRTSVMRRKDLLDLSISFNLTDQIKRILYEDSKKIETMIDNLSDETRTILGTDIDPFKKVNSLINETDGWYNKTALEKAIINQHYEAVQIILNDYLCNLSKNDHYCDTLLRLAINQMRRPTQSTFLIIKLLLDYPEIKTLINTQNIETGQTVLHAIMGNDNEYPELIQLLLQQPAIDVDSTDKEGNSPLHLAVKNGHVGYAQHLLEYDLKNKQHYNKYRKMHFTLNNNNESVFSIACNQKSSAMVSLLLQYIKIKYPAYYLPILIKKHNDKPIAQFILAYPDADYYKPHSKLLFNLASKLLPIGDDPDTMTNNLKAFKTVIENEKFQLDINKIKTYKNKNMTILQYTIYLQWKDAVKLLIEKSDLSFCDNNNNTLLHNAAKYGTSEIIKLLLQQQYHTFDLNKSNKKGETPLILAMKKKKLGNVQFLLDQGADINKRDNDGKPAIEYLIDYDNDQLFEQALSRLPNKDHLKKLLSIAVRSGKLSKMILLLKHGADPTVVSKHGQTLLHKAVIYKQNEIAQYLMKHVASLLNAQDDKGNTPLHIAITKASIPLITTLLQHDSLDINLTNNDNLTPFDLINNEVRLILPIVLNSRLKDGSIRKINNVSCLYRYSTITIMSLLTNDLIDLKTLLVHNFDINAIYVDDYTLLERAIEQGNIPLMTLVLACENLNTNNKDALNLAIVNKRIDAIDTLLSAPFINVNYKDNTGNTALHYAVIAESTLIMDKLLNCADLIIDSINDYGNTPLDVAVRKKRKKMVEILLTKNHSPDGNLRIIDLTNKSANFLFSLINEFNISLKTLFQHKINIEKNGRALLKLTLIHKRPDLRDALLNCPDITTTMIDDEKANSMLHLITGQGYVDDLKAFLDYYEKHKLNPNPRDSDGNTPLHLAAQCIITDKVIGLMELLLQQKDINVNLTNKQNQSALQIAVNRGDVTIINFLLKHSLENDHKIDITNISSDTLSSLIALAGLDIDSLLKHNIDINRVCIEDFTLLGWAIAHNHKQLIYKLLADPRLTINTVDGNDNTAIHIAIENNNYTAIDALLTCEDLDLTIKNKIGNTPLHVAAQRFCPIAMISLFKIPPKDNKYRDLAINAKNKKGETALHIIARKTDYSFTDHNMTSYYFLHYPGIAVNETDSDGNTALHLTASTSTQFTTLLHSLLKHPNITAWKYNREGLSPCDLLHKNSTLSPNDKSKLQEELYKHLLIPKIFNFFKKNPTITIGTSCFFLILSYYLYGNYSVSNLIRCYVHDQ